MATIADLIGSDTASRLVQAASGSAVCKCGRAKSRAHQFCPKCSRYAGPTVIVESPSGDYVEHGGLESAESLIAHTNQV